MGKLEGKNAIVTGGGRGVGRAISLAFAQEGANVVVNYAGNQKAADEVVGMIQAMGRKAVAVKGDVGQEEDAKRIVDACVENFGSIHILVNNAGISKPAMLHKLTVDVWDEVVNVQMRGPWLMIKAASKYFMEQKYGRIVNVTSVAGMVGTIGQINYAAAKGGVVTLTKSAARELAKFNVTANVISLGIVTTEMTMTLQTDDKLKEIYVRRILLNRYAEPEDVAPAFVFFASDDARYITGQVLPVDGGYGMT
ncbi:MAG TPA: 3-oxoacyl-ACP reductase family protein [Syntrophorhabdus sp.]|jgi:3-oxoacyl-[acyl-carrier protein] reductase|nr:3-oxoacyl-ACP reductase FabG [Syntrophorhabdus sp.]MDI9558264.1 3-oxoacyl-ACP reductase family protein [Pseudomonadota bacterium]OPX93828.1 MAG: 3-oxoacyl-(acyl-carrier-protein) reductase FabG [Syntrophorhabdus sp. PtaB.Bin027]OQB77894.1 MAG: 3-oxoacyl-(acyl-carrier-protein) reductase FabG [Deltaproteobacteria bacterium ADurb.Bin135]MBP8744415.1 3-oxoacyl-ACP reductase FabG [Syntrophorhabdus sp.]